MKKHFLYALVLLSASFGCSPKIVVPDSAVNYISAVDGTITLRAIGEGANEKALATAQQKAINTLLFRGVPESPEKLALIGTSEDQEKAKHADYFTALYSGKRYKTFILSAIPTSKAYKESGRKKTAFDIKVNVNALRMDLEANNIIRKFGY